MITVHSYRLSDVTIYSSKWTQLHRSKPILGVTFSGLWTICISTLVKLSQLMLILLLSWLNRFQSSAEAIRGNLWKSHDALKDRWGINLKLTAANAFFHANSSLKRLQCIIFHASIVDASLFLNFSLVKKIFRAFSWAMLFWDESYFFNMKQFTVCLLDKLPQTKCNVTFDTCLWANFSGSFTWLPWFCSP